MNVNLLLKIHVYISGEFSLAYYFLSPFTIYIDKSTLWLLFFLTFTYMAHIFQIHTMRMNIYFRHLS